jgi:uncharacterized protein DUF1697
MGKRPSLKYVGFSRAINVGGKNFVRMADVRAWLQALGFKAVTTYIQSENILVRSGLGGSGRADDEDRESHSDETWFRHSEGQGVKPIDRVRTKGPGSAGIAWPPAASGLKRAADAGSRGWSTWNGCRATSIATWCSRRAGALARFRRATSLPDEVFLAAARTLAQRVQQTDLDHGSLYHRCKRSERSRLPSRLALPRRRTPWVWRARRPKHLRQAIAGVMYQP